MLEGAALLELLPACDILHVDKGYDANAIRRQVEERGTQGLPQCRLRYDWNAVNFLAAVCIAATFSYWL